MVNEMAKMRYRTGNEYACPMVVRTPYGGGIHGGHYHSQSPEAFFLHIPGLVVAVISSPYDAKGLLSSALRSNDPVLLLEPKRIYRSLKQEVPEAEYFIPLRKSTCRAFRKRYHVDWVGSATSSKHGGRD